VLCVVYLTVVIFMLCLLHLLMFITFSIVLQYNIRPNYHSGGECFYKFCRRWRVVCAFIYTVYIYAPTHMFMHLLVYNQSTTILVWYMFKRSINRPTSLVNISSLHRHSNSC